MASDATTVRNVKRTVRETRERAAKAKCAPGVNRSTAHRNALKEIERGFEKVEEIASRKR